VFAYLVSGLLRDALNERVEVVAFEERDLSAVLAEQQVFVPVAFGDERLASLRLVDALDEVKFLEFFERAIHGHKTKRAVFFARQVEDLDGGEGALGILDRFDDSAARGGEAVSVFLQLFEPDVNGHFLSFLKLKIIFNKYMQKKDVSQGLEFSAHPRSLPMYG
jgi:hypothetical protein